MFYEWIRQNGLLRLNYREESNYRNFFYGLFYEVYETNIGIICSCFNAHLSHTVSLEIGKLRFKNICVGINQSEQCELTDRITDLKKK